MNNLYCSYYTKSDPITSYMVSMIDINKDSLVLEPSAGDGVFIDALLNENPTQRIDALELDKSAINILNAKYGSNQNIRITETDTLLDDTLDIHAKLGGYYDRIIGNPPYGAWQDYDKRNLLKKRYNGHYVKETYALFLIRCISLLKDNGILSFIIPDTFMYLHMHTKLRLSLLTECKIKEILIFPSKLFPGVSFGYSSLSIITVQKCSKDDALNNVVRVIKDIKSESDFYKITSNSLQGLTVKCLNQNDIFMTNDYTFLLGEHNSLNNIISSYNHTIGDIADAVTGIYCGDNKKFMKVLSSDVKGGKGYPVISEDEISESTDLNGVDDDFRRYVQIVKGNASTRYIRKDYGWYLDWHKEAIYHYTHDKKARFQNSQYYFRRGIALPMVKSSKINAILFEGMVFDQSIVGVFPREEKYLFYLLAFLNSNIARDIIDIINPTANNSANYIKKIPIILPDDEELNVVDELVSTIIKAIDDGNEILVKSSHDEINKIFTNMYL